MEVTPSWRVTETRPLQSWNAPTGIAVTYSGMTTRHGLYPFISHPSLATTTGIPPSAEVAGAAMICHSCRMLCDDVYIGGDTEVPSYETKLVEDPNSNNVNVKTREQLVMCAVCIHASAQFASVCLSSLETTSMFLVRKFTF